MDIKPSPAVTTIGSLIVVLAVALLAIYLANNYASIGKWVAPKKAAA